MPAQTVARNLSGVQQLTHQRFSALVVTAVTLLALMLGWQLKFLVQNRTEPVAHKGVTALMPAGWLVQSGAGDLAFLTRNPTAMQQKYGVNLLLPATSLNQLATQRSLAWGRANDTYRVIDETPIILEGENGYKVHYTYMDLRSTGMPAIIEGVIYYFNRSNKVLATYYENEQTAFDKGLDQFRRFLDTVQVGVAP